MLAGLTAGAIAAIIAALVSLPLHSPVDSGFNSATVVIAALVVGVISGFLWSRLAGRLLWFLAGLAAIFVVALVIAFAGNTQLDRMVSYMVPLAAIVVVVCAVLTPLLASFFLKPALGLLKWAPVVAVIVALAVGFGLVTQGDAESGELSLPPRPTAVASPPTETPVLGLSRTGETPASGTAAAAPTGTPVLGLSRTDETLADSTAVAAPTEAPPPTAAAPTESTDDAVGTEAYVIGQGSEITFTVEEELGRSPVRFDAVISSTGLSGVANLSGEPSVVTLDLHSLESDQQFRDQYIRSRLFPDTPEAVVTVEQLPDLPQSFLDGEETTGQLEGSLQIGDSVTPLVFDVTARRDGSTINVLGKTTFTWDQLGLPKPTARSVVYLAEEVRVQVLLVAQAAP